MRTWIKLAVCSMVVVLMGAAPATQPATARSSSDVQTFHAVQDLVDMLPSKCVPDAGAKWTNVNLSISTKWMHDHVVGDVIEIPVYLRNMRYIKEYKSKSEFHPARVRADAVYQVAITKDNRGNDMWEQRGVRCHGYWLGVGIMLEFPEKFVDQLAKVEPFNFDRGGGTKLLISGKISRISFSVATPPIVARRKSIYASNGVDIAIEDCQIISVAHPANRRRH